MCFTPQISLTIFAIEWILGFIVVSKIRGAGKYKETYSLAAILLFVLGFYQFTQFMFCTSGNFELWGKVGFLAYNFLPALGVHFAYALLNKRPKKWYAIYFPVVIFALAGLSIPKFMKDVGCSAYFITATSTWSYSYALAYGTYYFAFIIYTAYLLFNEKSARKEDRMIRMTGFMGIFAFIVPTFILIIIFPPLGIMFPSVLCEFALLFAISVFYMIRLIEKANK